MFNFLNLLAETPGSFLAPPTAPPVSQGKEKLYGLRAAALTGPEEFRGQAAKLAEAEQAALAVRDAALNAPKSAVLDPKLGVGDKPVVSQSFLPEAPSESFAGLERFSGPPPATPSEAMALEHDLAGAELNQKKRGFGRRLLDFLATSALYGIPAGAQEFTGDKEEAKLARDQAKIKAGYAEKRALREADAKQAREAMKAQLEALEKASGIRKTDADTALTTAKTISETRAPSPSGMPNTPSYFQYDSAKGEWVVTPNPNYKEDQPSYRAVQGTDATVAYNEKDPSKYFELPVGGQLVPYEDAPDYRVAQAYIDEHGPKLTAALQEATRRQAALLDQFSKLTDDDQRASLRPQLDAAAKAVSDARDDLKNLNSAAKDAAAQQPIRRPKVGAPPKKGGGTKQIAPRNDPDGEGAAKRNAQALALAEAVVANPGQYSAQDVEKAKRVIASLKR